MMLAWTIKRASDLRPVPWRNGLGTTRDVFTELHPDGRLLCQVSIAELERDAAFSVFPGCDRVFTPIAGEPPPALAIDGGAFRACPLLVPVAFAGDVPTLSRVAAPGRAFNLVADRAVLRPGMAVRRLPAGAFAVAEGAAVVVLYCHSGAVRVGGDVLEAGDAGFGGTVPGACEAVGAAVLLVGTFHAAPSLHPGGQP